jgi:hypothetical protein
MPIFRNIFGCSSQDTNINNQQVIDIKSAVDKIENRVLLVERDMVDKKFILQKIEIKMTLMDSKIDRLLDR